MAEATGELLYLPHHRERHQFRVVETEPSAEEADQEVLNQLFDQMIDVAAMPTHHADRLNIQAEVDGNNPDREIVTYQLCQRQNKGLAFFECVDSVILVREEEDVAVVEYSRTYYRGRWRQRREADELQFNWVPEYEDGSFDMCGVVLTEAISDFHWEEARREINRRATEQRLRYMVGAVAMTRSVH